MTRIVSKTRDFLIAYKPAGVLSQADKSGDESLFDELKSELRAIGERDELYLIHRLDRVVGGLLVFARNKGSAASLSTLVKDGELCKEYFAVVDGEAGEGIMVDYLVKDATLGKARVCSQTTGGAKRAELEYQTLASIEHKGKMLSLVKIKLHTGRFHQIRAQFSSRNMPLFADKKYGSKHRGATPALFAYHIAFDVSGLRADEQILPDMTTIPWSLFNIENYK